MDPEENARRVGTPKLTSSNNGGPIIIPTDLASYGKHRLDSCPCGYGVFFKSDKLRNIPDSNAKDRLKNQYRWRLLEHFLVRFWQLTNRRRKLMDEPWTFFKDMVIFKVLVDLQKTANLVLDEIQM